VSDIEIIFCGLSKNNIKPLKENISFLIGLNNFIEGNKLRILIVDSDSTDGTKEYLEELSKNLKFLDVLHKDNMELIPSRIERIKICRNICLDYIDSNITSKKIIYIPCDMDISLFSEITYEKLNNLIKYVIQNKNNTGIFPVSIPFYYDIFALRAKGWLNINSQLVVSKLKRVFKIGSFFWNYLFIFRYQLSPIKIRKKNINITSAFGGIGIYDVTGLNLKTLRYDVNERNTEWFSEHLYFNSHFKNLEILPDWIIKAPSEHILFKSLSTKDKIIYFLKSIKYDLKNIF
jgi:hypothetical protein